MSCEQFQDSKFSECDNRKFIVCEDSGKKYILENDNREYVCKVKIDNGFIQKGERCDWLTVVCERKIFIFIELKGSNIEKACSQILSTIHHFEQDIQNLRGITYARIVAQKVPNITGTEKGKLLKTLKSLNKNKTLKAKELKMGSNKKLKEKISYL